MTETFTAPPGLKGVVFAETAIGDVLGNEGRFHYRGFDAIELAKTRSLEDVWHLVQFGRLPEAVTADRFRARVGEARADVDSAALQLVHEAVGRSAQGREADAVEALRVGLAALAVGEPTLLDESAEASQARAVAIAAQFPTLIAAAHRASAGLGLIAPDPRLGHVADYVRMVTGKLDEVAWGALEKYLVATIDHGSNASTFAARVVASTGASFTSSVLAGLGAFLGPLHGGAPSRALAAILEIEPGDAGDWVDAKLAAGERIMGFGHAAYRTRDPRSEMLREIVAEFDDPVVERAMVLEGAIERALERAKPGRGIHANVEFYAGVLMRLIGLPPAMFTPTFATARVIGWGAHILEEASLGKIIRPSMQYVGPMF